MTETALLAGPSLRRLRKREGLTQAAMAASLGISPSYLNLIERNQRPLSARVLVQVIERFDFDPSSLREDEAIGGVDGLVRRMSDKRFADLGIDREEVQEFLEASGLTEPGLNVLIRAAYELLGLQTYFTAGEKEVRAWTIKRGFTAPQAAGVIHTDFEKGFIRAEVIKYDDYVSLGSEQAVKEAGKLSVEGKEYIVQDGDIMHFRFNV